MKILELWPAHRAGRFSLSAAGRRAVRARAVPRDPASELTSSLTVATLTSSFG